MKNSTYLFSLKRIIFFTYLIFTVLPSKATILKFKCVGNFGYDVSHKINIKNRSEKKSRPIFTENKNPKSYIVTYDLETGNGSIDGSSLSEVEKTKWNSLIFKTLGNTVSRESSGLTRKSTSELEDFSFIIDNFDDGSNVNRSSYYFTAHNRRELENLKYTLKEDDSFRNFESETKTDYEFISGRCRK